MNSQTFDFYDRTSLKSYNLDESMRYQLNMLDKLDVFTRKHSENVGDLTCRLCQKLHCSKSFTEYCAICAYLHDIGKQFIPSNVLQKPGKLTEDEFAIMKTHTTIGYKMCMNDLKLRPYAAGTYYHHEALDGSGYPQGLEKKDIPYEAQIIRVADEYDAISSKRQYKTHIGISDTIKILIENSNPNPDNPKSKNHKVGKNNPLIVKKLIKVVIEDTEYEIFLTQSYLSELKSELKRLSQVEKYEIAMNKAKTEKNKAYYLEGMKQLLINDETPENYKERYLEYQEAFETRKAIINNLYNEIKILKKLKV